MVEMVGDGIRKRVSIDGESLYIIVTHGEEGPHICCTCPRENAPENMRLRTVTDAICSTVTEMMRNADSRD